MRYPFRMSFRIRYALLIFTLCGLCLHNHVWAQRETPGLGSTRNDSIPTGQLPLDTFVDFSYVLLGAPEMRYTQSDTFTWGSLYMNPLPFDQAHLGNYGSAARPLIPSTMDMPGFATGWHQYDPYYIHEEKFKYYHQEIPVARIRHTQANRSNTTLSLDFGRSFAEGVSLSIAYRRLNQFGQFFHQQQKNTGLGVGIWHHAPSGKYDGFYNLISNVALTGENGGITAPELIGQDLASDLDIPVAVRGGLSEHNQRILVTHQIFRLTGSGEKPGIDLWLRGKYRSGIFRFADPSTNQSLPGYYDPIYLFDERGIRQFTNEREHQWSFGLALPLAALQSTIKPSLRYRNIRLNQEPQLRKIHELYLDVNGFFHWITPLQLQGDLSFGLGQAQGAFSFRASGDLDIGPLGSLHGHWHILSRKPWMVETTMYVNQHPVYQESFRNPFTNEISVSWKIDEQQFIAGASWIVYDQYIWFDSIPVPRQIDGAFSLRRFFVSKGFDFKWIGLNGRLIWQPDVRTELAIPDLIWQAGLYGRIRLFERKLTIMPGVDVMHHSGFAGVSYFPVTGVYHLTGSDPVPDYMRLDVALGIHIRFLKIFARMEDLVGLLEDRAQYQTDRYPHFRGYFRLGIEAGFFN